MAKASIALSELVEKGAKDDVVRELLGHVVERLMEFEIEQRWIACATRVLRLRSYPEDHLM